MCTLPHPLLSNSAIIHLTPFLFSTYPIRIARTKESSHCTFCLLRNHSELDCIHLSLSGSYCCLYLKIYFLQVSFQQECAEVGECMDIVRKADVSVDELDPGSNIRVVLA